jgi:hypothetical protein
MTVRHYKSLVVVLGWFALLPPSFPATTPLPPAAEILSRFVKRAQDVARQTEKNPYQYEKRSLMEELDPQDQVIKTTEKTYRVRLIAGLPFSRLVKIQGRALSPSELQKEDQREQAFRQKVSALNFKKMADNKETWLTPQLLDRFEFTVKERVRFNERNTLVLNFRPKSGKLPVQSMQDQIMNRLAGQVWIDEEEAEAAYLTVHLSETVSLGFLGVLASLKRCDLVFERKRMPDGVWVNTKHTMLILGRKLFSSMSYRITEESRDFARP